MWSAWTNMHRATCAEQLAKSLCSRPHPFEKLLYKSTWNLTTRPFLAESPVEAPSFRIPQKTLWEGPLIFPKASLASEVGGLVEPELRGITSKQLLDRMKTAGASFPKGNPQDSKLYEMDQPCFFEGPCWPSVGRIWSSFGR